MLEALQEIEIASRLVGFDADSDDSLDEKYMKLQCDITPLSHDSEDYRLIEKYLLTTHAPTHKASFRSGTHYTGDDLFIQFFCGQINQDTGNIIRIGFLNWKKFSHLKGKENLISLLPIEKGLRTGCSSGMVSCSADQ